MDEQPPQDFYEVVTDPIIPFDERKQEAVIGHLIRDEVFFLKAREQIKYHWFGKGLRGEIWEKMLEFYNIEKYKRRPTAEELKSMFASLGMDKANEFYQEIDRCMLMADHIGLDVVVRECTAWLKAVLIQEAAATLMKMYKNHQIEPATKYAEDKLAAIKSADFDPIKTVSFADTKTSVVDRMIWRRKNACTTGSELFNRALLNGDAGDGGLAPGDFTVILGAISQGKTSFLGTVAIHNIRAGKDVLMMVHENHSDNIQKQILLCMLKCPESDLIAWYQNPEKLGAIQEAQRRLHEHLEYVHLNSPTGTTVEHVMDVILEKQREHKRTHGKGFDLLVDDFPAKLTCEYGKRDEYRQRMYFIYSRFAALAESENFHALVAIQTNRSGSILSRDGKERALIMEDTSESWGVPQVASNFITINRSDDDRTKGIIKFHIDKCRSQARGKIVVCNSKFEWYQTHGDDLGEVSVETNWDNVVGKETAEGGVQANGKEIVESSDRLRSETSRAKPNPNASSDDLKRDRLAREAAIAAKGTSLPTPGVPEEPKK